MSVGNVGIEMSRWGSSHWSVFDHIVMLCDCSHDGIGKPDGRNIQTNRNRHPGLGNWDCGAPNGEKFGIRLAGGVEINGPDYDEWDCMVDLDNGGLVENVSVGADPMYVMTKAGIEMASRLKAHTAAGGAYHDFSVSMEAIA